MLESHATDTDLLNSNCQDGQLPASTDVAVIGGGIHSLIYAIQAKKIESLRNVEEDTQTCSSITVFEKSGTPGYKIGESTLTVFGVWLKSVGIDPPLLWRLFGPKDGLDFFYFREGGDPEDYSNFCANGPPADFVPTLQVERPVSELLLTLYAQRNGVKVLHGHSVEASELSGGQSSVLVKNELTKAEKQVQARLVVDATGRFRRVAGSKKEARMERMPGIQTNAYWAYFECPGDESEIPLRNYESTNTNHLCIKEGWAWVIRLPSWQGSPMPNLIRMINHLLDLNERKTAFDDYPSAHELAITFGLKFRWVVSIGFALRKDVEFPDDLSAFGSHEGEKRFNYIVSRYTKIQALMDHHVLIDDLYGPNTTWFIRKSLSYRSPKVCGDGWVAIGDAVGFTNPLYSPGINANMCTSVFAANLTSSYLAAPDAAQQALVFRQYEEFCHDRIPNLHRLNRFNYLLMRSPRLGSIGPLWVYLCGTGSQDWQRIRSFDLSNVHDLLMNWDWGANSADFIAFSNMVINLLDGPATEPSEAVIRAVQDLSDAAMRGVMAKGIYKNRWAGLLRWYDNDLNYDADKVHKDILARRCDGCRNWRMLRPDMLKCPICGYSASVEDSTKVLIENIDVGDAPAVQDGADLKDLKKNSWRTNWFSYLGGVAAEVIENQTTQAAVLQIKGV